MLRKYVCKRFSYYWSAKLTKINILHIVRTKIFTILFCLSTFSTMLYISSKIIYYLKT